MTWNPPPPPNNDVIYYIVVITPFGGGDVINSADVNGLSADLMGIYGECEGEVAIDEGEGGHG